MVRLIHTTIQGAKSFAAGQAASAMALPRSAALAEGVLKAMYWTRIKIVMMLFLVVCAGGTMTTFWASARSATEPPDQSPPPHAVAPAADAPEANTREDTAKLIHDMAQSRLNLRTLALAMHAYAEKHGHLPAPAIYGKDGKALLSWRVALLPYLDQGNLYKLFHLSESWDSPHNRKLLETYVPKVYAPPGRAYAPLRTYYQVFVSPARGGTNMEKGMGGALFVPKIEEAKRDAVPAPADPKRLWLPGGIEAAFVKRWYTRFPAHFPDGTANTILIVEAGNAVPWTKPEDLHYAADEPLPELGGLFRDFFQAAFASRDVYTLTKKYDEATLRAAITANGGEVFDREKIEAKPRHGATETPNRDDVLIKDWQQKNERLRRRLQRARDYIRMLQEERDVQRHLSSDSRLEQLMRENAQLQVELAKILAEREVLDEEINRLQKSSRKKAP